MKQNLGSIIAGIVAVFALVVALNTGGTPVPLGAAGTTHTEYEEFLGGITLRNNLSSTTAASATINRGEIGNFDSVTYYPSVGAVTLTIPASSTLGTLFQSDGQIKRWCVYNGTTTAAMNLTFAAGAGIDLEVASSTSGGAQSPVLTLTPDNSGCFEFQRKGGIGANNDDIVARFTRFVDGD